MTPDARLWRPHPTGNGGWEIVHPVTGETRPVPVSQHRHRARVDLRNAVNNQPYDPADLAVYQAEVIAPLKRRLTEAAEADMASTKVSTP